MQHKKGLLLHQTETKKENSDKNKNHYNIGWIVYFRTFFRSHIVYFS
jgi:hypothetical protein